MQMNKHILLFIVWILLSVVFIFYWAILSSRTFCAMCIMTNVYTLICFAVSLVVSYFAVPRFQGFSLMFKYIVMLITSSSFASGAMITLNYVSGETPKEEVAIVSFPRVELDDSRSFEYNQPMVDLIYENENLGVRPTSASDFYMKVREGDTVSMLIKKGGLGFYVLMDDEPISIKYGKIK